MNLTKAIEYFITTLPKDPCGEDDILNDCLLKIQTALGQPDGDAAGVYFSGKEWFDDWMNAVDKEDRVKVVMDYIHYELNHLPINTEEDCWAVTADGYLFKVECFVSKITFNGHLFTCRTKAIRQAQKLLNPLSADELMAGYWRITSDGVCLDARGCSDGMVIPDVAKFLNEFEM